ncbi:uncharacterized protein OCT59_029791 [Rhizophagus irregularis]|uniref:uncharacterized protein n=1 Tax=Rhizophagus irregularis TaxID=588596 RepID=UPI00331CAC06|nr:hypothetical protein OCT59_029791 [Rhizophagus irregularis]
MIIEFANEGNLRSILSNKFNNIMWESKIYYLYLMLIDLKDLHELGYCHKDFQSNILQADTTYISDFELSGPANEQKLDGKVYGVMPYIAPEVLNGEPYTLSSDTIYSNSDAVFTSRTFTFGNLLPKPVNSSLITSYVNNEVFDSQLIDLEVSNSIQLGDIDDESKVDDLVN